MTRSLVKNAADPEQVRNAEKHTESKAQQRKTDLRKILSMAEGRRVIWGILDRSGLTSQTYLDGNPNGTCFLEGKRSIGTELFHECQRADIKAVFEMMQEHMDDGG